MLELSLNLLWLTVSLVLVGQWLRHGRAASSRRRQALTLTMALLLLLPVISISDDLAFAQTPAEADSVLRKASDDAHGHFIVHPALASLPGSSHLGLLPMAPADRVVQRAAQPATSRLLFPAIASRPPPQA